MEKVSVSEKNKRKRFIYWQLNKKFVYYYYPMQQKKEKNWFSTALQGILLCTLFITVGYSWISVTLWISMLPVNTFSGLAYLTVNRVVM